MSIKYGPPWLKALSSTQSPLIDDDEIHTQLARLKALSEREDRQREGHLFAGPMVDKPAQQPASLPFPELAPPPAPSPDRLAQPVQPTPDVPAGPTPGLTSPVPPAGMPPPPPMGAPPGLLTGPVAPPGAPPPPPPADRPPGSFVFPPPAKKKPESP